MRSTGYASRCRACHVRHMLRELTLEACSPPQIVSSSCSQSSHLFLEPLLQWLLLFSVMPELQQATAIQCECKEQAALSLLQDVPY